MERTALASIITVAFAQASVPDPALLSPTVFKHAPAEYAPGLRQFQGTPGLERAPNGRLWAVWYTGGKWEGPGNFLVVVTSGDEGKTWSRQSLTITPPKGTEGYLREFDACLWLDPTGKLWLFWTQSVATWDGRAGVWAISTSSPGSANVVWSKPRRLTDGVMLNKPIVSASGSWLFAIGGWKNVRPIVRQPIVDASHQSRESLVHPYGEMKGSNVFESTDKLKSIHFLGQAQVADTVMDEHMLIQRQDKSFWMLVRTTYGIGQATSPDAKQWTSLGDAGLGHVYSRFFIRRLRSGNLLLVDNMPPTGKARSHMTARLSTDDGKTWSKGLLLDERQDVSYPDGFQSPDGRLFIVYDHDRRGLAQILFAVFTEEDVLAGHIVSGRSKLSQQIDALHHNP